MRAVRGLYDDEAQFLMFDILMAQNALFGVLFWLGISSGLRVGDLLALRVGDVGREFGVVEAKTGKSRRVRLTDDGWKLVGAYIEKLESADGRLFDTTRQTVYRNFIKAASKLGFEGIGTHSMRKTYGWNVWRLTGDIEVVRRALNHKYISTTVAYLVDGFRHITGSYYGGVFEGIRPLYEVEK
jgi:integrase